MERTYLQWNVVNWVTVVLMASLGATVIGFVMRGIETYKRGK